MRAVVKLPSFFYTYLDSKVTVLEYRAPPSYGR